MAKLKQTKWKRTLVRHTGWSVSGNPQFRRAVELRGLDTEYMRSTTNLSAATGGNSGNRP